MSAVVATQDKDYKALALDFLKTQNSNLTDKEQEQFLMICESFGLNPFIREIYAVKYKDSFNIIVGYETYIKRAERSGLLKGWRSWIKKEQGEVIGCVEIHRSDFKEPFYHEVYLSEYKQNSPLWNTKPLTMIKKVAIAQGFRMCFSMELGGMPYTADEVEVIEVGSNGNTEKPTQATQSKATADSPSLQLFKIMQELGLSKTEINDFAEYSGIKVDKEMVKRYVNNRDELERQIKAFREQGKF